MSDGRESRDLEEMFNARFLRSHNTRLVGGAVEPLYQPAQRGDCHRLFYREDYFASALHEIAHWCIAGQKRRQRLDFGYWYQPDGRTTAQQGAFEQVEVKPQALEWIFATAAGIGFNASADNLAAEDAEAAGPSPQFLQALETQALQYCRQGLPRRAEQFARALQAFYHTPDPLDPQRYAGRFTRE